MSDIPVYKNPGFSPEERAEDLLSRMTLREKIAQLDMKFGSKYCTETEEVDGCSVKETADGIIPGGMGVIEFIRKHTI